MTRPTPTPGAEHQPDVEALDRLGRLAELGMITATLTHEQRQPLFAIRSLGQLLFTRVTGAEAEMVSELLRQVEYLGRLVDGVGAYAREAGLGLGPLDLRAPVDQAVTLMNHRARRRGVDLVLRRSPDLPAVRGNATVVTQVVVNLVQNALDASQRGASVVIEVAGDPQGPYVDVADEGPGIAPELRERVFEPFFTTKGPGEGTGLGLHISRKLARDGGGDLVLVPVERGTRVRLRLSAWSA